MSALLLFVVYIAVSSRIDVLCFPCGLCNNSVAVNSLTTKQQTTKFSSANFQKIYYVQAISY